VSEFKNERIKILFLCVRNSILVLEEQKLRGDVEVLIAFVFKGERADKKVMPRELSDDFRERAAPGVSFLGRV
jgi:hypothetical protein